jgi:hypothetical protein
VPRTSRNGRRGKPRADGCYHVPRHVRILGPRRTVYRGSRGDVEGRLLEHAERAPSWPSTQLVSGDAVETVGEMKARGSKSDAYDRKRRLPRRGSRHDQQPNLRWPHSVARVRSDHPHRAPLGADDVIRPEAPQHQQHAEQIVPGVDRKNAAALSSRSAVQLAPSPDSPVGVPSTSAAARARGFYHSPRTAPTLAQEIEARSDSMCFRSSSSATLATVSRPSDL